MAIKITNNVNQEQVQKIYSQKRLADNPGAVLAEINSELAQVDNATDAELRTIIKNTLNRQKQIISIIAIG